MRKVACIFIFLTVTMMLCSQTKIWTLEECMEYAVRNNMRVSSQEARNRNYTQNYREAIAKLLPSVKANVNTNLSFGRGLDSETNIYTDVNSFSNTYEISSGLVCSMG